VRQDFRNGDYRDARRDQRDIRNDRRDIRSTGVTFAATSGIAGKSIRRTSMVGAAAAGFFRPPFCVIAKLPGREHRTTCTDRARWHTRWNGSGHTT
jgi:hypothetical protein